MPITLYLRKYPVADTPVAASFTPDAAAQRHTFTAAGQVYEAEHRVVTVAVPEDAKLDEMGQLLRWAGDQGPVKSTARKVYDLATAGASGFRIEGLRSDAGG